MNFEDFATSITNEETTIVRMQQLPNVIPRVPDSASESDKERSEKEDCMQRLKSNYGMIKFEQYAIMNALMLLDTAQNKKRKSERHALLKDTISCLRQVLK